VRIFITAPFEHEEVDCFRLTAALQPRCFRIAPTAAGCKRRLAVDADNVWVSAAISQVSARGFDELLPRLIRVPHSPDMGVGLIG